MFWKILLLTIAGLILLGGVGKIILDVSQENPDLNLTRDLIVTIVLASLAGIYPIIDLLRPSKTDESLVRIEEGQKRVEEKLERIEEREAGPKGYADGIPQSKNLNLRGLFVDGVTHLEKYEYDKAIKAFTAALALQGVKPSECSALLINIGNAEYKQNKWDEALGSYKKALSWAEKAQDEQGQAVALGNLGVVYQDKGEWDKAIEFYEKSLKIKEKIGDEHGMAQTFNNLGLVYKDKGEWDKAIEFYNKSLKGLEKIGDEHGMARTKGNIALLHKEQGKKEEARKLFREILEIFERIGDEPNAERTRRNLEDL